jgi:tRNA threonylcarbamoyladenosine biosynthesis protein TsaE
MNAAGAGAGSGTGTKASWVRAVPDEAAVAALAAIFVQHVQTPLVIFLKGDLGAGKTTFARAFLHALGYRGYVKSPSYGLLESYRAGGMAILHLDLYRIEDPEELDYLAIRDLYDAETVLLVEWPEKGLHHLPRPDLELSFDEVNEAHTITCFAKSTAGIAASNKILRDF